MFLKNTIFESKIANIFLPIKGDINPDDYYVLYVRS